MVVENKFKIIHILEYTAKICVYLMIFFSIIFLFAILLGATNFEYPNSIQLFLFYGTPISIMILVGVLIVKFILSKGGLHSH